MFKKSVVKQSIKQIEKIDNAEDLLKVAAKLDEQKKKLKINHNNEKE